MKGNIFRNEIISQWLVIGNLFTRKYSPTNITTITPYHFFQLNARTYHQNYHHTLSPTLYNVTYSSPNLTLEDNIEIFPHIKYFARKTIPI